MTTSINPVHVRSRHPVFYTKTVVILVEGCLFRVPREPLEAESTVFRDMFLLPQGDKAEVEGLSDANPVVLDGVRKKDFERLLNALMHRKYGGNMDQPILKRWHWISVLKLSTMWEFGRLRESAIDILDSDLDLIDKFLLAQRYDVTEWIMPTLLKLAQRPEPISIKEGCRLGWETALKIASVREKFRIKSRAPCSYCDNRRRDNGGKHLIVGDRDPEAEELDFTSEIRAVFEL